MTAEVGSLFVSLSADLRKFTGGFDTASRTLSRFDASTSRLVSSANVRVASLGRTASSLAPIFSRLSGPIAAALGGAAIVKAADSWTAMANRLRAAGVASGDLAGEQQKVVGIATASRAPLESVTALYSQLLGITQTLGVSQSQAATATQAISQALSLSGTSAEAASGAITQLGQALGSGVLRGDEFNSVMEALGTQSPIVRAIADEFGVAAQQLRGLAEAGQLTSDRVFKAIVAAAPQIKTAFDQSLPTVEQSVTNLTTAFTAFAGQLSTTTGLASGLSATLGGLTSALNTAAGALEQFNAARAQEAAQKPFVVPSSFANEEEMLRAGLPPGDLREQNAALARLRMARRLEFERLRRLDPRNAPGASESAASRRFEPNVVLPPPRPKEELGAAQLGDFVEPPETGGKGGGGGASQTADDFKRATDQIKERTLALGLDTQALGLNSFEATKLKTEQALLNEAMGGGKTVTADQRAEITRLAEQYAAAQVRFEEARAAQERLAQAFDDVRSVAQSGLGSFVSGISEGKRAADALNDSLKSMLQTLLQISQKSLLESLFGQSGQAGGGVLGSFLTNLFGGKAGSATGGLYAGASAAAVKMHSGGRVGDAGLAHTRVPAGLLAGAPRLHGGLSSNEFAAVLKKGEHVLTSDMAGRMAGTIAGLSAATGNVGGGGGDVTVEINNNTDSKITQRQEGGINGRKIIVDIVRDEVASGGLDSVMRGRFGNRPSKVR